MRNGHDRRGMTLCERRSELRRLGDTEARASLICRRNFSLPSEVCVELVRVARGSRQPRSETPVVSDFLTSRLTEKLRCSSSSKHGTERRAHGSVSVLHCS
ncbi:hypothetical protein PHSY_006220 [Pseudozyma hubeiensis SY62]|uniref:Uncharacterized protein n=1 Tax=Pseudozyma hubeiensis (strain SY62) TaxID=1305764 RepID=R9PB74_PSEHS|nr:hypothetical protein PHSY_006220 [Pseudozyma hubeiensis SY62]GAC98626.1 hypothetical protein PHSY_006220 [Pseudozyma hubeiensis SY62]